MGFTRAQLESFREGVLPDLLGPTVKLLLVGINPGLHAVATQTHFGRRTNRFYPALYAAGITDHVIDASNGFVASDVAHLLERGIGITSLVARATARADELEPHELVAGGLALAERVARVGPVVTAVLGITAFRTAFGNRDSGVGRQPVDFNGSQLWVVPNPSGLNAHASVAGLGAAYREVAVAAGIDVYPR
jgi:TDG/mug DNA glycosylase family protein